MGCAAPFAVCRGQSCSLRAVVTMDQIWTEAVKQAPHLVILAWIVHRFVQYVRSRDEASGKMGEHCHQFQREILERLEVISRESNQALKDASAALGRASQAMDTHEQKGRVRT